MIDVEFIVTIWIQLYSENWNLENKHSKKILVDIPAGTSEIEYSIWNIAKFFSWCGKKNLNEYKSMVKLS